MYNGEVHLAINNLIYIIFFLPQFSLERYEDIRVNFFLNLISFLFRKYFCNIGKWIVGFSGSVTQVK